MNLFDWMDDFTIDYFAPAFMFILEITCLLVIGVFSAFGIYKLIGWLF
jgi:hypothetical protein